MKRINTFAILLAASMACVLSSCQSFDEMDTPTNNYTMDIDHYVSSNFHEIPANDFSPITIQVSSPFTATIIKEQEYLVDNSARDNGTFVVTPDQIPVSKVANRSVRITRDFTVNIRPFEMQSIVGYGWFNYPVKFRQRGEDGTLYLSAEQLRAWKQDHRSSADWGGDANQHYIMGTVTSVSDISIDEGIYNSNTSVGPVWMVPAAMRSFGEAQELETREITIDVDGEQLTVKVHYFACYHLVKNQSLRVGDRIEMNVPNSGILADSNVIWVSPLDILHVQ